MEESFPSAFEFGTDGPRSLVVGFDGSEASLRAGAYAAGMARRQGCRLTAVYARTHSAGASAAVPDGGATVQAELDKHQAVEAQLRERLDAFPWELDAALEIRSGSVVGVLSDVADETRADAIVLGASRRASFLIPGGPLPVQLIRLRRWPVIVVP